MFTLVEIPPHTHTHSLAWVSNRASQRGSRGGKGMMLSLVPSHFPAELPGPQFSVCEMDSGPQLISSHKKAWGGGSSALLPQSHAIRAIDALVGPQRGGGLERLLRCINNKWAGWNRLWPAGFHKTFSAQGLSQACASNPSQGWEGALELQGQLFSMATRERNKKHFFTEIRESGRDSPRISKSYPLDKRG